MTNTIVQKNQSCDFNEMQFETFTRTPPERSVHSNYSSTDYSMCNKLNQIDRTTIASSSNSRKLSRRKGRYLRRKMRRFQNLEKRNSQIGNIYDVFTYGNLYNAGKKCCNVVRWKQSTQNFEHHLFSITATQLNKVLQDKYKFSKYQHFIIKERGKAREIDAPHIKDRQVEKLYTKEVLLPLYLPTFIKNNGASLEGKGFHFSLCQLKKELKQHYKKYGRAGGILLSDAKSFFPSANHQEILNRHNQQIFNKPLKDFGDKIIKSSPKQIGLPLGVEVSQVEMVAYPANIDNYMKSQVGLKGYGHYMDDFYFLIPPNINYLDILKIFKQQAEKYNLCINLNKTKYIPLTKPFCYCKARFRLTETGKIIIRCSRASIPRARRKIKAFKEKLNSGQMSYTDLWASVNSIIAYLKHYNEYYNIRKLQQLFYNIFHFSCEKYQNFKNLEITKTEEPGYWLQVF